MPVPSSFNMLLRVQRVIDVESTLPRASVFRGSVRCYKCLPLGQYDS